MNENLTGQLLDLLNTGSICEIHLEVGVDVLNIAGILGYPLSFIAIVPAK